jgi:hypothetical protein
MKIGAMGRQFDDDEATGIDYASTRTVLEFDAIFVDSYGLTQQVINSAAISFRLEEFLEFLSLGRTIVVFIGTSNLKTYLPIETIGLKPLSGKMFDFKGPDYLKAFWLAVEPDMQYLAHIDSEHCLGKPFLFVPSTNKPVATWIKLERGNILLLPFLSMDLNNPFNYRNRCGRFVTAFKKLNDHLAPKKQTVSLPAWSAHYGWERERKLRENLVSLQKQTDEISKQISTKTLELEIEDKLKVLFASKGDVLVDVVIGVFQELGAKANPGEPGRDDVIVEFEGKHAVIEVKGKKSSAAESDAAQLEKWVVGFKEEKGADPKGILLIDAHCETPLAERTDPAFPHQMLKYSTQREHCLITTTQLLGLLLEARANPEKRVDLVNSLFSTVGVFQQFSDWKKFLTAPAPASTKAK